MISQVAVGSSVLDVGCGCGLFLALLSATGRKPRGLGFDQSQAAIDIAAAMVMHAAAKIPGETLEFVRKDVADPWPQRQFDVVSIIDVMHHVPPSGQRQLLVDAASHVRPGGTLLYKDMARRPAWRAAANRLHDLVLARQWIHYVPIQTIEVWGRELGLRLTRAERIDMLWYGHELRVFVRD